MRNENSRGEMLEFEVVFLGVKRGERRKAYPQKEKCAHRADPRHGKKI
jgi:hypothetical protein